MKPLFKTILQYYLKYITKIVLFVHRPIIIAVAGSTNKHFTKQAIKRTLIAKGFYVRSNPNNFNTEIGLPLAILDLPSGYNEFKKWLPTIGRAPLAIWQKNFPKYMVLELGVSAPGDMRYLLSIIRPKIIVITEITQRYIDSFDGMDALVGEYEHLLLKTSSAELIIANSDNRRIRNLIGHHHDLKKRAITFGFEPPADWQITNQAPAVNGQIITIKHGQNQNTHNIPRFGRHHAYAFVCGLIIENYAAATTQP